MNVPTRIGIAVVLACLLLASGAPGASGQTPTDTTYTVALDTDGDATVTLTYTFTLETAASEAAFDELQTDEAAREALAEQFQTEMDAVAERTTAQTNRSMAVQNATVTFERRDAVGEAYVRVEWTNLARVDDDGRLTLTEPFSTQFTPDGEFRVTAPASHTIASVSPEPDEQTDTSATWNPNTSLSGFALTTEPTATAADTETDDAPITTPGFTAALAALALALTAITMCRK